METDRVLNIGMPIAAALHAAHRKGLVRCELKPTWRAMEL